MAEPFGSRVRHAWNALRDRNPETEKELMNPFMMTTAYGQGLRPYTKVQSHASRGSIIVPIYNRIAIDVAAVDIRHIRVNKENQYIDDIESKLDECLSLSSNLDQTAQALFREAVMNLCDDGVIGIVPAVTTANPNLTDSYDVESLRIGSVVDWYPHHVRMSVYNEDTGNREEVILSKKVVAIVENPLFAVMNDRNSILQRLLHKLQLLDRVDEQTSSGKIDLIIQLPYVIKTDARREEAEKRRQLIEEQLRDSQYGIAYTDGTERITQLNRPAENNLLTQIEYLTKQLYSQLGLTEEIINGTADESAMVNYFNRTIEPFLTAITQSMTRTFLSKTARTQGQRVGFYRDPFKLMPIGKISEVVDSFTRNEVASSNEMRSAIGWKPSVDPRADELRNSNLSRPNADIMSLPSGEEDDEEFLEGEVVEDEDIDSELDELRQFVDSMLEDMEID